MRILFDSGRLRCSPSGEGMSDFENDGYLVNLSSINTSWSCGSPEGLCREFTKNLEFILELVCIADLLNLNSFSHRANSFLSFSLRCWSAYLMLVFTLTGIEQSTAALLLVLKCPVNRHGGLYLGRTVVALSGRHPCLVLLRPPRLSPWFLQGPSRAPRSGGETWKDLARGGAMGHSDRRQAGC